MTIRKPVSQTQVSWHNAQKVDVQDMDVEQNYNNNTNASIVNNHFGTGVLRRTVTPNILFNSDELSEVQASLLSAGDFDGTGIQSAAQPTDTNLGNQLAVTLTDSTVFGRFSTKVLIVGLDFQGNTQYDRFYFYKNETQVTVKHYTRILGLFFVDFKGNNNCSRDLGGTIVISEAASYQLSRDPVMISQDVEPNLFFRDYKVPNPAISLYNTIQEGIGSEYTVDSLNINTTVKINRAILPGDVTSKIGEKFLAYSNNIQKITLLLGAGRDDSAAIEDLYDWSGDVVITVYELQTTVDCPSDIIPQLNIEFEPKSQPLAQLSYSQAELYDLGYVLTDVLQPVDFVFSNTGLGSTTNPVIVRNRYYAVTINRSGDASSGTIVTGVGNNQSQYTRFTLFNGVWADVPEDDLWFQVWSDSAKVSDGQAYDAGNGIETDKTEVNSLGATVDYCLRHLDFVDSGEGTLNNGIVAAVQTPSDPEQDERTGTPVYSRQQFEPSFSFVTNTNLAVLRDTSEPMMIGCAEDINAKLNPNLSKVQELPGLVKGDVFKIVNPDPDLLSLNMIGSKLIPNVTCASKDYRIFKVFLCTDGYGDVNGDGVINEEDIARASELIGEDLSDPTTQQKIVDGYIDTLEMLRADVDGDGLITSNDVDLITQYVTRQINSFPVGSSFNHLEITVQQSIGRYDGYFDCDGYIRLDGYGGQNIVDPSTLNPYELMYDGYIKEPSIDGDDPTFDTVLFPGVTYQIKFQPFWQPYQLLFDSGAREVLAAFTFNENVTLYDCVAPSLYNCEDRSERDLDCDPGRTDIYVPNNLIIGNGQIIRPDGGYYPIDYEIGQVILQLPQVPLDESLINIMDKFVVDAGDGFTAAGFPAMRFADCDTVKADALALRQVKFGVAVQAFYPNLDGYDDDGYGIIVDDIIGVYVDQSTGILTLTIKDLAVDPVYMTLVTKIEITVHLKKAGWKNGVLVIEPDQIEGILSI